jgi:hypothetical protein
MWCIHAASINVDFSRKNSVYGRSRNLIFDRGRKRPKWRNRNTLHSYSKTCGSECLSVYPLSRFFSATVRPTPRTTSFQTSTCHPSWPSFQLSRMSLNNQWQKKNNFIKVSCAIYKSPNLNVVDNSPSKCEIKNTWSLASITPWALTLWSFTADTSVIRVFSPHVFTLKYQSIHLLFL